MARVGTPVLCMAAFERVLPSDEAVTSRHAPFDSVLKLRGTLNRLTVLLVALLLVQVGNAQEQSQELILRRHWTERMKMLGPASTQLDSSLDLVGSWAWGYCGGVAVQGKYILTGCGRTLLWLDASDPRNPRTILELVRDGGVGNFIIQDSIAYAISNGSNLLVIDLRNALSPRIIADLPITPGMIDLSVKGRLAYVKIGLGHIYCIDISNPSQPYVRSIVPSPRSVLAVLAATPTGGYVGNPSSWTLYFDSANPDSIRTSILTNVRSGISTICAHDTLLLMGGGSDRLYIYSTRTPQSPAFLSNLQVGGVSSITVSRDVAFVGTLDGGVTAVDIHNPRQPVIRGSHAPAPHPDLLAEFLSLADTVLYCAYGNGVRALSISNVAALDSLGFFPTGHVTTRLKVRNGIAYVCAGYSGVWTVDVRNPQQPRRVGHLPTPGYAFDIALKGDTACISINHPSFLRNEEVTNAIWLLDVSRPEALRVLGTYDIESPFSVMFSGSLLFTTNFNMIGPEPSPSVSLLSISDPAHPRLENTIDGGIAMGIEVRDSIAFVASYWDGSIAIRGLNIFDCRNPSAPSLISTCLRSAQSVTLDGHFAYVRTTDSTFVIDIADLRTPVVAGRLMNPWPNVASSPFKPVVNMGVIYWVNGGELGLVDVSSPSQPRLLFETEFFGNDGLDVAHDTLFIPSREGFRVIRYRKTQVGVNQQAEMREDGGIYSRNYPNPFNLSTNIEFKVSKAGRVQIQIFDILGQIVETVFQDAAVPGTYVLPIDAYSLASGTYYYRILANGQIGVGKFVLGK